MGELAGFNLDGEDGVEVFEAVGGDGEGKDDEGFCEFRLEARTGEEDGGCWGRAGV